LVPIRRQVFADGIVEAQIDVTALVNEQILKKETPNSKTKYRREGLHIFTLTWPIIA